MRKKQKMRIYEVVYKISVYAKDPIGAALIVEDVMNKPIHRPYLSVSSDDNKIVDIDLAQRKYNKTKRE